MLYLFTIWSKGVVRILQPQIPCAPAYHHITFPNDGNVLLSVCSMGGIPAVGSKGEHLLLFIGIIDILQSYR